MYLSQRLRRQGDEGFEVMVKRVYERLAWNDRFTRPSAGTLRDALHGQPRKLFDAMRKHFLQIEGISETFAWYGEAWRWSIEYRLSGGNIVAVLIPSPEDLQLAMLIDRELAESLPMRQLKRAVRDGLDLAADPFDTRWGVWSVQHPNMADDLKSLVNRKLAHLRKHAKV